MFLQGEFAPLQEREKNGKTDAGYRASGPNIYFLIETTQAIMHGLDSTSRELRLECKRKMPNAVTRPS